MKMLQLDDSQVCDSYIYTYMCGITLKKWEIRHLSLGYNRFTLCNSYLG